MGAERLDLGDDVADDDESDEGRGATDKADSKAFSDYWFDCSTLFVTLSAYQGL